MEVEDIHDARGHVSQEYAVTSVLRIYPFLLAGSSLIRMDQPMERFLCSDAYQPTFVSRYEDSRHLALDEKL